MSKIAVGDADSLVALVYKNDANHIRVQKISEWLQSKGYTVIYPSTAILEAVTALKRSLNLVDEAHLLNRQYQAGVFVVEYINESIQLKASQRFESTNSKKNTIFDAVVVETAALFEADYIFSFDNWYPREGFNLAKIPEK
ncbi:MAG: PIN domain-containing protein [Candidatus Daviesbacteria bacterium]|nr:PIN domain-containing protein [Candidatus Daviesbacteria bacterium]